MVFLWPDAGGGVQRGAGARDGRGHDETPEFPRRAGGAERPHKAAAAAAADVESRWRCVTAVSGVTCALRVEGSHVPCPSGALTQFLVSAVGRRLLMTRFSTAACKDHLSGRGAVGQCMGRATED